PDEQDALSRAANWLARQPSAHHAVLSLGSCGLLPAERDPRDVEAERLVSAVFDRIERECAALLRGQSAVTEPLGKEWMRNYPGIDARLETYGDRRIRDVELPDPRWQVKHWKTLEANYGRAAHFAEVARVFEPLYLQRSHSQLSALNRELIELVCRYLGIATRISNCWDYDLIEGKTDRLVSLAAQAGAHEYH